MELSSVFYDEASQANAEHIWWLISRLRSKAKMNPSIWLTCNPDVDSYLRSWVDWWLYPEHHPKFGLPDPDKNGKIRWLLRVAGEMKWANTAEELIATYGKPHLPPNHEEQVKPLQVQCLLGTIYDNPWLLKNQPEYLATLESLPDLERRRLLLGDWEARQANSTYFQRTWCQEIVSYDPSEFSQVVRSWDFAFTKKSDKNSSPDYTVGTLMGKTKSGDYIVLDVRRMRVSFGEWEKVVYEAWSDDRDKFRDVITTLPLDPGGGARMSTTLLRRGLAEKGVITKEMRATGKKLERFRSFSAMSETGGVKFVKNCGNDYENRVYNDNGFIYKELEAFDGTRRRGESGHDDIPDTMSDAFSYLASAITIPNFLGSVQQFQSAIGEQKIVSL